MRGFLRATALAILLAAPLSMAASAGPNAADAKTIDAKTIDAKTIDAKTIDAKTIDTCIAAAMQSAVSGGACIGIVADPCIAKVRETDAASAASRACAARELAVWNERMRRALGSAGKSGGREIAAALAASQKSWTEALNRLCPVFEKLDPGMALGGADYCRLTQTAMRALVLERLSDAVNPH